MKSLFKVARAVAILGQLGFTLITPPVLMALFGWWLTVRFRLGVWVIVLTLLLGLITAGASAWRFWKKCCIYRAFWHRAFPMCGWIGTSSKTGFSSGK